MTPEAQRITIAKACGLKRCPCGNPACFMDSSGSVELPDYLNDLNARKSAWRPLTDAQKFLYRNMVSRVAAREGTWTEEAEFEHWPEIFLRTIGKWEGSTLL